MFAETIKIIKKIKIINLLYLCDFIKQLANMLSIILISNNKTECYNMLFLNDFLVNLIIKFDDLN